MLPVTAPEDPSGLRSPSAATPRIAYCRYKGGQMMSRYPCCRAYSASNQSGLWSPTAAAQRCQSRPVHLAGSDGDDRTDPRGRLRVDEAVRRHRPAVPVHLVLKPFRGDVGSTTERRKYAGAFGEQMQVGVDDIAHAAVQLVRVEGDLLDLGGAHPGDRRLPRGRAAAPDPEHRRLRSEPGRRQRDVHVGDQMLGRLERGDRSAELLAHLGVVDRAVDHRLDRRRPDPNSAAPQRHWRGDAALARSPGHHRRRARRRTGP